MKILICDDDEVIRAFVQRVVEHQRHDALLAANGREALEIVQREDPDLLITDLRMPDVDGAELIKAVRAIPYHEHMPVVCLSSVSSRDDVARLIQLGISDYVLKPVRPGDLAERIRAVLVRERDWKTIRAETRVKAPAGTASR
jgi:DNA-binding response OmpR family regulator